MRFEVYGKKEKEKLDYSIKEKYGFNFLQCQIIKQSLDKLRIFTGNLSEHELAILTNIVRVETIGMYLARLDKGDIRFSFDASFLGKDASKNVFDLNDGQVEQWFKGEDIALDLNESSKTNEESISLNSLPTQIFVFLKYKNEMVGCGKFVQNKILNFVPKERRIKNL